MQNKYFVLKQFFINSKFKKAEAEIRQIPYVEDISWQTYDVCAKYDYEYVYNSIQWLIKIAIKDGLTSEQRKVLFESIIKKHKRLTYLYIDYLKECQYKEIEPYQGSIEYEYFEESELGSYAGYYPVDSSDDDTETINRIKERYKKRIENIKEYLVFEIPHLREDTFPRELLIDTSSRLKQIWEELSKSQELSFILKTPKLFGAILKDPKCLYDEDLYLP